jgi:hypothetical protein
MDRHQGFLFKDEPTLTEKTDTEIAILGVSEALIELDCLEN